MTTNHELMRESCIFLIFALLMVGLMSGTAPAVSAAAASPESSVYFDDSHPELIKLGNTLYYEIGLRKSNGGIAYITDKAAGGRVTLGSRYECLWGSVFDAEGLFVGGCGFDAAGPDRFTYTWSAAAQTLTLTLHPAAGLGALPL